MIIGLIRHFKVDLPFRKSRYLPSEFNEQMTNYDSAPIIANNVNMKENKWEICYSSDLSRAVTTAEAVYKNKVHMTDLLREVPLRAFTDRQWKLPSVIWHIGGRIAWRRNGKSQPETYNDTVKRINEFYDILTSSNYEKVLVITHGFFMRVFQEEMKKKGFRGEIDIRPRNGKLYVISK